MTVNDKVKLGGPKPKPFKKLTENEMAVKLQSKYQLVRGKQVQHLFQEIKLMNELNHPFILDLKGVSQDKRIVYMYVDFLSCGDLMNVINKFTRLNVDHARFYAAQMVCCLEYIHNKNFVYRDLKPENVLVTNSGYLKLADFGFIK